MLSDALSYPQSGDGWRPVLIGGLLSLFNWLLIPAFIMYGYYIRVLRGGALEEDEAPRFEDIGDLLVDGFKSFLIFLGYIIIPFVLMLVLLFSAGSITGENGGTLFLLVGLICGVLLLVMIYLFPVALTAFALTDDLGAAFELKTIAESAFTGDYAVSVILSVLLRGGIIIAAFIFMYFVGLVFGFAFIFGMLGLSGANAEPALGVGMILVLFFGVFLYLALTVLFSIVNFYAQVAMYYLLGRGSGASLRDIVPVDRPTPAQTSDVTPDRPDVDPGSEERDRPEER